MYSPHVIETAIARYERTSNHSLIQIAPAKVEEWIAHLATLWDNDKRATLRELTREESIFIRNERIMSFVDFRYWAERYGLMQKNGGGVCKLTSPWESQEILLSRIAKIEEQIHDAYARGEPVDGIMVVLHKARQLGACLGAGTRVLTADLRWVPIESVRTGDKLLALDEHREKRRGVARKMRVATVLNTVTMTVPTYNLKLDDGTGFTATPHHKFLAQAPSSHGWEWIEVQKMKPGYKVRRLVRPWDNDSTYEDGWFGGFLDGEGSVRYKKSGGCELCGAQIAGSVLDRAVCYLKEGGYTFRFDVDKRKAADSSKFGDTVVYKVVVSRMHDIFKLLGKTRPARFMEKEWWPGKELPNNGGECAATVVAVEPSLVLPVYDVETTTGTYVAEGMASHNTAIGRLLLMHRLTTQQHRRAMSASVDEDKIQELYDRDKLVYDNLPWYMKPEITYDEKRAHIYFEKLDSRVLYQVSSQKSGLGVGRQFDIAHLTELSTWINPQAVELDFFPTLPMSISTLAVLESTAYGRGTWWHDFTERVRKGNSRRWHYTFVPWYAEVTKYRAQPPEGWEPSEVSLLHAQKVYDTSPEYMSRHVMLSREQLYWYESTRAEYQKGNNLAFFLTNFCSTPEESFQHSGQSAFGPELLEDLRLHASKGQSYELTRSA